MCAKRSPLRAAEVSCTTKEVVRAPPEASSSVEVLHRCCMSKRARAFTKTVTDSQIAQKTL